MSYTEWTSVPHTYQFYCQCGSAKVKYRLWESSDGAHEDYNYHCDNCNRNWWVEGSDY